MSTKIIQFILFLATLFIAQSVLSITSSSVSLSSYNTLDSSVSYDLKYSISGGSIQAGSYVTLIFTNRYSIPPSSLSNCKASTSSGTPASTVTCSVIYNSGSDSYEIKFQGIFPSSGTFSYLALQFVIDNPYAQRTQQIGTNIYSSGGTIQGIGSAHIAYVASEMTGCSISSSTQVTGADAIHTYSFTPSKGLKSNTELLITMPIWSGSTSNKVSSLLTCKGVSGTDQASLPCSFSTISTEQTATISSFISSDRSALTPIQVSLQTLKNPWSFQPFGPISFELMIGSELTQKCENVYHTVSEPNAFSTLILALNDQSISATNNGVRLIFVNINPFPRQGQNRVKLEFPSFISVNYVGSLTKDTQSSTHITLSRVTSISVNSFTIITPPFTKPYKITVSTYIVSSGIHYKIDQGELSFQNSVGNLASVSVIPANLFVNEITTYTIAFTIVNQLISGSSIKIEFPNDIDMDIGQSVCTFSITGDLCSINTENLIIISVNSIIAPNTAVTATITKTKNANQAKTTPSFKISTYYDSNDATTLVDKIDSGVTVTMTANTLVSGQVTPTSTITYAVTSYTFTVKLNDPIPAGGSIQIIFPDTTSPQNSALSSASFSSGTCSVSETVVNTLQITGCFSSEMTDSDVTLVVSNVKNPPSLKPTNTFKLYFKGVSSTINYMQTGLIVTMATAVSIPSLTITPGSLIVGQKAEYNIKVAQAIDIHQIGDYIILELPTLMNLPSTPSCSVVSGPSITCTRQSNNRLKLEFTSTPASTALEVNLNQLTNYLIAKLQSFNMYIHNSEDYLMQQYIGFSLTYAESQITSVTVNDDDNVALGEASQITLTFTNAFSLYTSLDEAKTKMLITIPTGFTASGTCVSTKGTCVVNTLAGQYEVNGIGKTLTNVHVTLKGVILNYFDPKSESFKAVYTYDGSRVSVKESGITLVPYCTSPCQRCDVQRTACESCLPAPNTFIYYDPVQLKCATSCDDGKYPDDTNECTPCVPPCDHCLDQSKCTKCVENTWLMNTDCLLKCPDQYYNDDSGVCLSCQDPCDLCSSLTSCKTCKTLYISGDQCVAAEDCPQGTFPKLQNKKCQICKSPCANCQTDQSTCTSCQDGYLYYDNKCEVSCPETMYQNNKLCLNCVAPCVTCTSNVDCKTCDGTLYLGENRCVEPQNCPDGTYPKEDEKKCKSCPAGCTQCESLQKCTNCDTSIYIFYEFKCITACPDGTFKSGNTCQSCQDPCKTCSTAATSCRSCHPPKLYINNRCSDSCPAGTYPQQQVCQNCLDICSTCVDGTSCQGCHGQLFFQNNNCVSQCSPGYYKSLTNNVCESCGYPCAECQQQKTNCKKCVSPLFYHQSQCLEKCPDAFFGDEGICKTCPDCVKCIEGNVCLECKPSFYEYSGACYSSCPENAPIKNEQMNTCGSCNEQCRNCEGTAKNCTQCYSQTYLHKGSCLAECPLGFIQDVSQGICVEPLIGNIVYFPFLITFLFCFIVVIASKCMYKETEAITALAASVSLCQFGSWALLAYILTVDYHIEENIMEIGIYLSLAIVCLSIGSGIAYNIAFYKQYQCDRGVKIWKKHQNSNINSYRTIVILSVASFRFFRFLYSRLFNRVFFSMYIADGGRFLSTMSKLTVVSLVFKTLPMVGISGFLLYSKLIMDQTFFCAIDTIILGFISCCLLMIDSFSKGEDFFENLKQDLPFIKYRNMFNDESFHGSLISRDDLFEQGNKRKTQSQLGDSKEKEEIFRKITFIDNNKYGHLNVLDDKQDEHDEVLSLPEYNKLDKYDQFDPYHRSDGDMVIDDLFFQENQRKRREEEEQLERQRLKRIQQEQEEQRRRKQQQERKRRLMEQDQQERVNLEFPDLIAIDKVQGKNQKGDRKNPLDLLSKNKKMDDRKVNDKALKKLQQIGKKNGIDPNFMKQAFGIEKNHNPDLLNKIIDKHNHVKRESVKQLFNNDNNKEILQELFSKNSKIDPDKLKEIMNDPDAAILINNLANQEKGRLSPEMAKQLFDKDSKYNKQFTKQLLGDDNGMDHNKLQLLLKDASGKGKESPLKALKKLGGENLENKELLNNMLGEDAKLNPENFTRVANDLSIKAIENLFKNKSDNADIITEKILNNKKINLKDLSPILQDQELLNELANTIGQGNPHVQENLMNLFKNADNIDPQKLKQMLANPVLKKKLLGNPVDPEFLNAILSKDSNADLNLLGKTLLEMPEDVIKETFKFDPSKNVDFKNLATLFDKNPKTDPRLVSKMLQPDMVKELYYKGNETKMLNKLVQKGSQFDPQVIKGVYGKQKNNFFDTHTDNLLSLDDEKKDDFKSQKDFSLGFQRHKNQVNMSRTAGGMMNFLTPIIPKNNKNSQMKRSQDEWSSDPGEDELDDDAEIREEDLQAYESKRKKKMKKMKKKIGGSDIRLAAQEIYLQRIQAPYEAAMRKANIRKKKKKVNAQEIMDEDNDIFDMNF